MLAGRSQLCWLPCRSINTQPRCKKPSPHLQVVGIIRHVSAAVRRGGRPSAHEEPAVGSREICCPGRSIRGSQTHIRASNAGARRASLERSSLVRSRSYYVRDAPRVASSRPSSWHDSRSGTEKNRLKKTLDPRRHLSDTTISPRIEVQALCRLAIVVSQEQREGGL